MQETGQTQSNQPAIVTTPIENLPSNTPQTSVEHEGFELIGQKKLPEVDNIDEYRGFYNKPYSLEYFQLDEVTEKVGQYKEYAELIDDYVMREIDKLSLDNSLDTYKHIIEEVSKALKLHPMTDGIKRMERVYKYIKRVLLPKLPKQYKKRTKLLKIRIK